MSNAVRPSVKPPTPSPLHPVHKRRLQKPPPGPRTVDHGSTKLCQSRPPPIASASVKTLGAPDLAGNEGSRRCEVEVPASQKTCICASLTRLQYRREDPDSRDSDRNSNNSNKKLGP
uniref:Uncharacterized protein n=1 Tax=Setaria viridis TaxID=4556 RepID=A0A4U6VIB3_SETVI|nr:hypothetical protein SEVIR_3G324903v2 [Setaria viridis]